MEKYQGKYRIPSNRHHDYDYSSTGIYYVTICTKNRNHYFGEIANGKMIYKNIGKKAFDLWQEIPRHFPFVHIDEFVIMPDHLHGLLVFNKIKNVETQNIASRFTQPVETQYLASHLTQSSIETQYLASHLTQSPIETQNIVSHLTQSPIETQNIASLHISNQKNGPNKFGPQSGNLASVIRGYKAAIKTYAVKNKIEFFWQSKYYDHIIRDDFDYYRIKTYIQENISNWGKK